MNVFKIGQVVEIYGVSQPHLLSGITSARFNSSYPLRSERIESKRMRICLHVSYVSSGSFREFDGH